MSKTHIFQGTVIALLSVLLFSTLSITTYAHNGESHEETLVSEDLGEVARLEKMITLLGQLVTLYKELRTKQIVESITVTDVTITTADGTEMEVHHDEHEHESEISTDDSQDDHEESGLIIEVETHFDRTHVHARFLDKPEEMFFVDAGLDDETALIEAIHEHTGLTTDEIKEALTYL